MRTKKPPKVIYTQEFNCKFEMLRRKGKPHPYYNRVHLERCLYDPDNKVHMRYLRIINLKHTVWTFSETEEGSEKYYFLSGFDTNPTANILGYFITDKPCKKQIKVEIDSTVCYVCKKNICMGPNEPSFTFRDFFIINNEWVLIEEPTYDDGCGWDMGKVIDEGMFLLGRDPDDNDCSDVSFHMGDYENKDIDHIKNPHNYDLLYWGGKCMNCHSSI